jgi:VanZ family protein
LAPFDFDSPIALNGARWVNMGIDFPAPGIIRSPSPPNGLAASLKKGTGLTLEVWAAASDSKQGGPARIVSYSKDTGSRNFTLGQQGRDLIMRLRTARTGDNGTNPQAVVKDVVASKALKHIVVTYDFSRQTIYIDGRRHLRAAIPGGDFSNWDSGHDLLLGNETTGNRPWLGRLSLVAIYDRALTPGEIRRRFDAGPTAGPKVRPHANGAIATFDLAHKGEPIADLNGTRAELNLWMPSYFIQAGREFLEWPEPMIPSSLSDSIEIAANVSLFVPLGLLVYLACIARWGRGRTSILFTLSVGGCSTLSLEVAQWFLPGRASSARDVVANLVGTALGIVAARALCSTVRQHSGQVFRAPPSAHSHSANAGTARKRQS